MREVWVFPGQGSQYPGMGRALYQLSTTALDVLRRAEAISGLPLGRLAAQGPRDELIQPAVLEPAVAALQIAYVDELKKSGARPDYVAGYSLGELGAFYCAEVITREDALEIAVRRSRILQKMAGGPWRMATVRGLPSSILESIVARLSPPYALAIGAYNAPGHAAITGETHGVIKAEIEIASLGGVTSVVDVAGPWHSSLAADCMTEVRQALQCFDFKEPVIPLYSSMTGGLLAEKDKLRDCLAEQIAVPVLWNQVLTALWEQGVRRSLEIGPGHVLTGFVRRAWPNRGQESRFLERENGSNALPPVLTDHTQQAFHQVATVA